ncbi:MAG: response regulator [Pseudomonadota bacterium]|nr:response regulator [Pseudomonadota bacterium]
MTAPRVLIVEDEAISARAARIMLERIGCVVTDIVGTGDGAIVKAGIQLPDLVLMDIRLKGDMDGIEAAAIIHERFRLPVIFVSAYSVEELAEQRELVEGSAYLAKPIGELELAAAVGKVLSGKNE